MAAPIYHITRYIKFTGENAEKLQKILDDNQAIILKAKGSIRNHQAWEGGYLQHVADCIRIAQYISLAWPVPFSLHSVILVLFLHDIEKPFMQDRMEKDPEMKPWNKEQRSHFRNDLIVQYGIQLTEEEKNALKYVEGEGADYSNQERKMNELAALCHAADVLSSRLWHSRDMPK